MMEKSVLDRFRHRLLDERASTIGRANRTVSEDAAFETNEFTDEIDQASAEYDHGMVFKLCDRENHHLRKIDHALQKISNGEFGICEECGAVGRPVAHVRPPWIMPARALATMPFDSTQPSSDDPLDEPGCRPRRRAGGERPAPIVLRAGQRFGP